MDNKELILTISDKQKELFRAINCSLLGPGHSRQAYKTVTETLVDWVKEVSDKDNFDFATTIIEHMRYRAAHWPIAKDQGSKVEEITFDELPEDMKPLVSDFYQNAVSRGNQNE
jgi:hypothetical protein